MSSSVHIDNIKKHILILGKGPTQRLDDTTLSADSEYFANFSRSQRNGKKLQYNGSNSFSFVKAKKLY